jgi:hypothetical protein
MVPLLQSLLGSFSTTNTVDERLFCEQLFSYLIIDYLKCIKIAAELVFREPLVLFGKPLPFAPRLHAYLWKKCNTIASKLRDAGVVAGSWDQTVHHMATNKNVSERQAFAATQLLQMLVFLQCSTEEPNFEPPHRFAHCPCDAAFTFCVLFSGFVTRFGAQLPSMVELNSNIVPWSRLLIRESSSVRSPLCCHVAGAVLLLAKALLQTGQCPTEAFETSLKIAIEQSLKDNKSLPWYPSKEKAVRGYFRQLDIEVVRDAEDWPVQTSPLNPFVGFVKVQVIDGLLKVLLSPSAVANDVALLLESRVIVCGGDGADDDG